LKHAHIYLYYDQVAWLPLPRYEIIPELLSHTI